MKAGGAGEWITKVVWRADAVASTENDPFRAVVELTPCEVSGHRAFVLARCGERLFGPSYAFTISVVIFVNELLSRKGRSSSPSVGARGGLGFLARFLTYVIVLVQILAVFCFL